MFYGAIEVNQLHKRFTEKEKQITEIDIHIILGNLVNSIHSSDITLVSTLFSIGS